MTTSEERARREWERARLEVEVSILATHLLEDIPADWKTDGIEGAIRRRERRLEQLRTEEEVVKERPDPWITLAVIVVEWVFVFAATTILLKRYRRHLDESG